MKLARSSERHDFAKVSHVVLSDGALNVVSGFDSRGFGHAEMQNLAATLAGKAYRAANDRQRLNTLNPCATSWHPADPLNHLVAGINTASDSREVGVSPNVRFTNGIATEFPLTIGTDRCSGALT